MAKAIVAVLLLAVALCAKADPAESTKPVAEPLYRYPEHYHPDYVEHHREFKKLTLWVAKDGFINAQGGASEAAYSIGAYEYKVSCGSPTGPVVGTCAETGIYLTPPATGKQLANFQWSCVLTESCGYAGTGTLNGLGVAPGGDWTASNSYPQTFTIEGGTGDFSHVVGGTVTYYANKSQEMILYY